MFLSVFVVISWVYLREKNKLSSINTRVRQSRVNTKVHRAETFPRSLKLSEVKRDLLFAGARADLSFFVEYYEFDTEPPYFEEIIEGSDWYQDSKGSHFHEKSFQY